MKNFLENRKEIALTEGKEELELCNLGWNDSFLDCYNYTPDFDFGQEEHEIFFHGCMQRIYELDLILKELNKVS